ncbi:DUF3658 domain-containing protein [Agrobacterium sp. T29]|uniref:DUF3658 domain-containing protein n=1 Tax=Agrobacterium sp. T29 TaxID=2580515 RepID=UPI00115F5D2C|nr:DUF3658 domain-containing protein [Agrobacterium sp. T29]
MLHVVPSLSASGSLKKALSAHSAEDRILSFRDDLSCGPIASLASADRVSWWQEYFDWPSATNEFDDFWEQVDAAEDKIVLWFGKYSAREFAFRLAWAAHMNGRPYHVIDVSSRRSLISGQDSADTITRPAKAASVMLAESMMQLVGSEQSVSAEEDARNQNEWARLRKENAFFRIVTPTGLTSAAADHFDILLLQQADTTWRKAAYVVGNALGASSERYYQVGDLMLIARLQTLMDQGKLEVDGDPFDIQTCCVRLPAGTH